jgi:hypothetical protein
LIGRSRTDEDELSRTAAEQSQIGFDVLGREGDPIDDDVERGIAQQALHVRSITDVAVQHVRAGGNRSIGSAAIQQIELEAALDRQARAGRTDDAGAPNE